MIKLHAENRDILSLVCRGSTLEVAAEIGLSINRIYSGLYKTNPLAAEQMRRAIEALVLPNSPIWTADESVSGIFMTKEEQ